MNEFAKLQYKCAVIDEWIENSIIDPSGQCESIPDGIVDIQKYIDSKVKILWILKEPYDDVVDGKPYGGGWHYIHDMLNPKNPEQSLYKKLNPSKSTFHPIAYVSYSILNDFKLWSEMDYIRDDQTIIDAIYSIAIINVKKLPGFSVTSDYSTIIEAYYQNREILHRQIDIYNPDVVIGGNTMNLFFKDLGIFESDIQHSFPVNFAEKNNRIFIDAYHPAQKHIKRELYINSIVTVVKNWCKKNNKI